MTKRKIRWIAFLSILAISSIVLAQGYWVYQLWNYNEKKFSQTIQITLARVAKQLVALNGSVLPGNKYINQVTSNYFVVNINDRIKIDELEYYLIREFQNSHISEDFEYGVYDCADGQMVYGNYIKMNENNRNKAQPQLIPSELPKFKDFTYYFGVLFPQKNLGLVSDMRIALLLSLLLVGAILIYLYALWVIIRQNELSELQKDFINNMTHEFKTPLTNIRLATSAIQDDLVVKSSERVNRLSNIINQQNLRLTNHVEKILQLARMERDNFVLEKEAVNLNELIFALKETFALRLENEGGKMEINLPEKPIIIQADRVHLANILDNLVDNAIKYTRDAPYLNISLTSQGSSVFLSVHDHGIGMDVKTQKKAFAKFYRHSTGNVHDVKGFGLGLYYVMNVCNAHKWKLKINSELNKGTKIDIIIPTK